MAQGENYIPWYHLNSRDVGHSLAVTGVPGSLYNIQTICSRATITPNTAHFHLPYALYKNSRYETPHHCI